jgi:hypothetical protein
VSGKFATKTRKRQRKSGGWDSWQPSVVVERGSGLPIKLQNMVKTRMSDARGYVPGCMLSRRPYWRRISKLAECELLISQHPEAAKRVIEEGRDASCFPGFYDRPITERRRDGS